MSKPLDTEDRNAEYRALWNKAPIGPEPPSEPTVKSMRKTTPPTPPPVTEQPTVYYNFTVGNDNNGDQQ